MIETRWCPSCGGEFHAGVDECPDCGVPLEEAPHGEDSGESVDDGLAQAGRREASDPTVVALRWAALVAGVFWVVAVVLTAWATWEETSDDPSGYSPLSPVTVGTYPSPPDSGSFSRLRTVVLSTTQSTAPYLLVAVVSLGCSGLLGRRRAPAARPANLADGADDTSPDRSSGAVSDRWSPSLATPRVAGQVLIWVGVATFALWAVHFLHSAWTFWEALGRDGWVGTPAAMLASEQSDGISLSERLRTTFIVTIELTGAYLLTSVVAFGLGVVVRSLDPSRRAVPDAARR